VRPLPLLLLASLLAGCGAAPLAAADPEVAVIPAAPTSTSSSSTPPSDEPPAHASRWAGIDRIKEALRVSGGGHQTIALEPKGRLVVTDVGDGIENELHLEDVDRVVYSDERSGARHHCVQMWLKPTMAKDRYRWRKGEGEWMLATGNYLPLCVSDKGAADDILGALRLLMSR
jgi:hypothetical protein